MSCASILAVELRFSSRRREYFSPPLIADPPPRYLRSLFILRTRAAFDRCGGARRLRSTGPEVIFHRKAEARLSLTAGSQRGRRVENVNLEVLAFCRKCEY